MRRSLLYWMLALGGCLLLSGCAFRENSPAVQETAVPESSSAVSPAGKSPDNAEDAPQDISELLEGMTLREKVGQLFLVRPDALDPAQTQQQINDTDAVGVTVLSDTMRDTLDRYPVGGVVLFGKNLTDPEQLSSFTARLHDAGGVPLLIAVDEEGGAVARLANHPGFDDLPDYPSAARVAAGGADAVYEMSVSIGSYLKAYGIDLDFAPVADVNTNPDNPIIGDRAFSDDPMQAAELVSAAVKGFHDGGVLCCLKHYPGHGDTAEDSHKDLAVTQKDWQQLLDCELVPFRAGIDAGADLVMAGHIAAPGVTGEDTPASMSPELLESLRQELEFDGVIVTDSLAMEGITKQYSPAQAAVLAVQAGADILLMPDDLAESFDAVVAAVEEGTIPESRVEESVARILALKQECGLI